MAPLRGVDREKKRRAKPAFYIAMMGPVVPGLLAVHRELGADRQHFFFYRRNHLG